MIFIFILLFFVSVHSSETNQNEDTIKFDYFFNKNYKQYFNDNISSYFMQKNNKQFIENDSTLFDINAFEKEFNELMNLGKEGIKQIIAKQKDVLKC